MNNQGFIELLHEACAQTTSVKEMDEYLDEALKDVFPYNICYGKRRVIELNIDGECIEVDMKHIEK